MIAQQLHRVRRRFSRMMQPPPPWHRDLCDYYHVTPEHALELGTRSSGRRPELPASATTAAISGKTFEEIWDSRERRTPEEIHAFYQEIGAWASFRQVVYHRDRDFGFIARDLRPGSRLCEYGAGVAPVCAWTVEYLRHTPLDLTIVDVPSEHFTFGEWRLRRRIQELRAPVRLEPLPVQPDRLPLEREYDVITLLEVFEHLHNPIEVAAHLVEHLRPGGVLWENFVLHEHASGADLDVAQAKRAEVYAHLREQCDLVSGRKPEERDGGGTRSWRRR